MKQNELAIIDKQDLLFIIEESIQKKVFEANEKLLEHLKEKFPSDEIISLEDLAKRLKKSEPTVRKMAVSLGFIPHVYAENKPPYYILSEVIDAFKQAPGTEWYQNGRALLESQKIKKNS